jgi:phosphoglucosamine mutase
MGSIFGTDGVRGLANADLTAELALDLSVAAAHVLGDVGAFEGHRPVAVVGRDPRASGEFLSAAVVAGLASAGVDVVDVGVVPTPAVAYLTAHIGADLGAVISASHNAMPDNGLKFLARGGHKLADELEDAIEKRLREDWARPTGAAVGRIRADASLAQRYAAHLLSTVPHPLAGLKVVLDAAHGAAYALAPQVLRDAGAEVVTIGDAPDGLNINDGYGSTHPDRLRAAVVDHGADAGIALDGDADRCLAVDASGEVVDGDQIMAILAVAMRDSGHLHHDTAVVTVMSKLGFRLAMERERVNVVETGVGDRYVLEAMKQGGYSLGGEQSGHVIMLEHATTGDGTLTALHLLSRVASTGSSLAGLAAVMERLPQVLVNVKGVDKSGVDVCEPLQAAVREVEAELGVTGRVLLRPSGTEPVVRVMVEAPDAAQAQQVADRLAEVVLAELSLEG